MKFINSIAILMFLMTFCSDENSINSSIDTFLVEGFIFDAEEENRALSNVTIICGDSETSSDSNGYFRLPGIESGDARLLFEYDAYQKLEMQINLNQNVQLDIFLFNKINLVERLKDLSYYPLNVGDYWEYSKVQYHYGSVTDTTDSLIYSIKVLDDILGENNNIYKKIEVREILRKRWTYQNGWDIDEPDTIPEYYYINIDSLNGLVTRYSLTDGIFSDKIIMLNLFTKIKDSYNGIAPVFKDYEDFHDYKLDTIEEINIFGIETHIKLFTNNYFIEKDFILAQNLGVIYFSSFYEGGMSGGGETKINLIKANIAGITYETFND